MIIQTDPDIVEKASKLPQERRKVSKRIKGQVKKQSLSKLKHKLDTIFSKYIRTKYSKDGICICFTCGKRMTIAQAQNGHFVARSYLATRFDEDNCRPQCVGDNIFGNGKPLDFEEHLREEIGDKRVDDLKARRHQIVKLTPSWYENKIEEYKLLLN